MRKLPLGIVALAVFAVAPTFGATKGVEVTRAGFTPNKVTVDYGDTVTWTNRDNVSHQVLSDRGEFPASPVLEPNQTYSYTFMKSGSFGYRDALNTKKRGTVVVRTGVSIAGAPASAVYGSSPTVSGLVSSGASGETVVARRHAVRLDDVRPGHVGQQHGGGPLELARQAGREHRSTRRRGRTRRAFS